MPAPLKNRPRLQQQDLPYHEAFCVLSKARQSGAHGSQAIPVSEIKAYLELVGIASLTAKSKYLSLVQDLDQMCLEHWVEKQQAARDDRRNQSRT